MTSSLSKFEFGASDRAERGFRPQHQRSKPASRVFLGALGAGVTAAALLFAPEASAQAVDSVKPDGKGVVGGALLGIEVVDLTLGAVGVNAWWPYLVFGGLGGVGGGIGGYFIEQETRDVPEVALYMLAGGMALVIPTIVVSLNATMYKPPEGATTTTTTEPANNQPGVVPPAVQPGPPGPGAPPVQTRRPTLQPQGAERHFALSLVDVYKGSVSVALPAVDVRPLYSRREMWTYGLEQGTEVRVPVFHAAF